MGDTGLGCPPRNFFFSNTPVATLGSRNLQGTSYFTIVNTDYCSLVPYSYSETAVSRDANCYLARHWATYHRSLSSPEESILMPLGSSTDMHNSRSWSDAQRPEPGG